MPEVLTSDGVRLCYQDDGAGQPLLIVPGILGTAAVFVRQVEGLRGCGTGIGSSSTTIAGTAPPKSPRMAIASRGWPRILMEALGLDDVSLMGWSMGCSVAWSY